MSANLNLFTYLLRLADDNMVLSQRLGELVSWMPELEEDIAIANLSLDHLGQATSLYAYAGTIEAAGRNEDALALTRSEREFMNAVLVEQPNGNFADTIARQFLVDAYQVPLYQALSSSTDQTLGGIAQKAEKEARYHLEYSSTWLVRLGDGTDLSHDRAQSALDRMWPFAADLFATDDVEAAVAAAGMGVDPTTLRDSFDSTVARVVELATLRMPTDTYERTGGRTGMHTEHLGHLLAEMQSLHQAHLGATW